MSTLKPYLVFHGYQYYPSGGGEDFHSSHNTLLNAKRTALILSEPEHEWAHVFDTITGTVHSPKLHEGWHAFNTQEKELPSE